MPPVRKKVVKPAAVAAQTPKSAPAKPPAQEQQPAQAQPPPPKPQQPLKPLAWGLLPAEWKAACAEFRQPAFRAKQIWKWLQQRRAISWDAMTDIPTALRDKLAERYDITAWTDDAYEQSADDGVRKLLLCCRDGVRIESVIIPARDQSTLCISSQAGCAFGCAFCATGKCGFERNLDPGEIVGQFVAAAAVATRRLTHVVFMGMGEPFANYDNVIKAVRILNDFDGIAIGARRMTLSTCGVVPGIERLATENLQVELSVSLHAPTDELRSKIMPVNKRWPMTELMAACDNYTRTTGRVITFEYTLVDGFNNLPEHADRLIELIKPMKGRVNLIPLSPVEHFDGVAPDMESCEAFARRLQKAAINVTLRRSKGKGVTAACGQLRLSRLAAAASAQIPVSDI